MVHAMSIKSILFTIMIIVLAIVVFVDWTAWNANHLAGRTCRVGCQRSAPYSDLGLAGKLAADPACRIE